MENQNYSSKVAVAASQSIKEKTYWLKKLTGNPVKTSFPYDYNKIGIGSRKMEVVTFRFPGKLFSKMIWMANESDVRLHMILIAGLVVMLEKYTGIKDIILGTPIYKQAVEGNFINTVLAIRNQVQDNMKFKDLLYQVKETIDGAVKNQNYPIKALLYELNPQFSEENFPLFDIDVVMENIQYKRYIQHISTNMSFSFLRTGECLEGTIEYNSALYHKKTIERITTHFTHLLERVIGDVNVQLSQIDLLSEDERKRLLVDFNNTKKIYPGDKGNLSKTVYRLFEEQVEKTPGNIALVFDKNKRTYREFNKKANRLARVLKKKGIGPENITGLLMESSIEMVVAIIAVLKVGAAYLPIDTEVPEKRKKYLLKDSGVRLLLTDDTVAPESSFIPDGIERVDVCNEKIYVEDATNPETVNKSSDLAYIIYTSGSTGKPKGVMVEHRQAVNTLVCRKDKYKMNSNAAVLQLFSYAFDGFVTSFFTPLISGARVVLMSKHDIEDITKVIEIIVTNNVTHFISIPVLYRLILANISEKAASSLEVVTLAGDKLQPDILEMTAAKSKNIEIVNEYGITESAVMSTIYRHQERDRHIKIGKPIWNSYIYITKTGDHHKLVPIGIYGEICIAGCGVARGYMNNPDLTIEKFVENPFFPGQSMLKTGDMGKWLQDGNIEFAGRMDDQIKIRGFRIEAGEIEKQLLAHKEIKEAVVVAGEIDGADNYLCAYIVTDNDIKVSELREYLLTYLPYYMIPAYFVSLEKLPLSTNGKINRKFLPPPEMKTDVQYAAPRDNIEQKLVEIWSDVLGWDADMGIDDNFFEMGGHSLKATILMSRIHKEFNIKLPLADIFTSPTIRELSDILKRVVEEKFIPIEPAEEKGYYTLSSAQKRLYFLQQMDLESTAYNISQIVLLEGEIDMKRLENTFNKLIARHESLRTSFLIVDDIPVQKIHDPITLKLQCHEKEVEVKEGDQIHHFIRPFELSTAPLICVSLIKTGETKHLLIVDMHHIISDGVSQNLLIQNFVTLYKREDLPGLRLQYKDYSQWQNCDNQKKVSKQQKEYWLKEFAGHVPILNLPVDYLRPGVQSFEGSALDFEIGIEETKALNNLAKKEATTLFVVLLTVFNILLSKISNQQDIIIGTPVAGRKHADLEHIIGMFVNTLAVRNFPINEKRVTEFLREVNENTLNAFENQDYPFEELVEQVEIDRDVSRNPLFEVMFVFQNMDFPKVEIAGLKISPYKHKSRRSKFDLGLSAVEAEEKLLFSFEYCTKLFKQGTIEKFISFYKKIISSILNNANKQISQLEIISEQEKKQILFDFNDTEVEYPQDKTIHELFAEQVNRTPDNIAVVGETHQLHEKEPSEGTGRLVPLPVLMSITYKELNERSNHLAHLLQTKNVKPDTIAAIMVDRSLEMITAVFGILKAGGAYLPIEPGYPGKRINYMLADSRARVLVTTNILAEEVKKNSEIIFLDSLEGSGFYPSNPLPFYPSGPSNLAYVIYTSGTTGKPKGVLVETRNAVNLVWGLNHKIYKKYNRNLRICLLSPFVFDASVKQIFAALLLGHSLYIVPEEARLDGSYLLQYYKKHKIDISDGTPTHLRILLEGSDGNDAGTGVKEFIIGGEVLPQDIVREFFNKFTKNVSAIVNIYGPSECTVDSTLYEVTTDNVREFQDNVPIGTPMPNCRVYVLDCWKRLQPVGIPGELYVSGTGVGRGYLNRAPLTAEKFIPEPFNEGKKTNIAVHKMYRTGDLARMLPGGSIEFLGRTDNQVKIRGFRIELGEIEAHLLKHEKIKNVVVLIKERNEKVSTPKDHGEKYITVYFTSDEDINVAQLKIFLSERLPQYMIPSYFVQMEKIPLTHNGKVDRKALDSYGITGELGVEFVAPESEMEKIIANIWKEVLDADKVGVHDNFFDIGGHSLSLIKVNSRLKTIFHKDIPIADMFGYPTISSLVRYFTQSENRELSAEINERIDEAVGMMDEATDVLFADEID